VTDNNFLGNNSTIYTKSFRPDEAATCNTAACAANGIIGIFTKALKDLRESVLFLRRGWEENP
jgi:hypothetical protein